MAGTGVWIRLLERHRARLSKDPDMNRVVPRLIKRGFFSHIEERQLQGVTDPSERTDILLDKLSRDPDAFREFCMTLEECAPHLLTELLLDRGEIFAGDKADHDNQALELGFELALKERDAAVREQARTAEELGEARRRLDLVQAERDRAVSSLDNLSTRLDKPANPKRFEGRSTSGSSLRTGSLLDSDEPQLVDEGGDNIVWQIHRVTLQRVANYGFGIAVSGGHDSPHFASGDPSIAISDVLKAGPAEGKLQLNDRIISANGISLENVSHSTAIQVLKNSGDSVHLVVRRRVVMPVALEKESPPLKVTLVKKNKKDDFGLVLGCRFFIQDVVPDSLAAQDGGLKTGDTILKVNNTPLDGLSIAEVKKLIEKSKDRLQLIVSKSSPVEDRSRYPQNRFREDEGYATFRPPHDKDDINVYRPSVQSEEEAYLGEPPPGAYPASGHAHYDGRYIYDHEGPPRPPLPGTFPRAHRNDGPHSPGRDPLRADGFYSAGPRRDIDGYYSDHDMDGYRGPPEEDFFARPNDERYVGLRSDVRTDMRRVVFQKDRQKGLGLRLAGGNATGIFIASVQPSSAAEVEGLVEGDQILQANGLEIVGLTREEAVAHLTSLEGQVTLVVQYKKEDYDGIMASHEAGDSFYIRTHFNFQPGSESGEHGFKVGDIFHIKDTLFRGVGGSWLAIRVGPNGEELKKGTIPNRKKAESLAISQQESGGSGQNTLPSKGRSGLFKRKSSRRAKSVGKDHWEDVMFSGLETKFPPYERVVLRDPAFVRPLVVFGAIADVARDMLAKEFPDRFEFPQTDQGAEADPKKEKLGVIRFAAIQEAMNRKKHCVLDVMPYHVDRLNYAQYYPIVVFLRGESKQAIKDVRSRWRGSGGTHKNPKKLQEHNERMENTYSHLFTGTITHTTTDAWFPKLVEMIQAQQRRPVWMSEKKPDEDFNDDLMFPMPNRNSMAGAPDAEFDFGRPLDDLDTSPMQKKRLVRSSSDPSINTGDRVPGIPPYPAPPGYSPKMSPYGNRREDWDDYRQPVSPRDRDGDWQMHPDDRYYPHPHHQQEAWQHPYPPPQQQERPYVQRSRSNIDVYATITPSERMRKRPDRDDYPGGPEDYGPHRDRMMVDDPYHMSGPRSPHDPHLPPSHPPAADHRGYNDGSSNDNDSYSRYVSSAANKHDDSKLRDKFGALQVGTGRERSPASHDPYRFTRSTANPVTGANIDRAKLSHLTARYRKDDPPAKPAGNKGGLTPSIPPAHPSADLGRGPPQQQQPKKKDPPPVPVKTYSLKEVGMDTEEMKARNYENSNRSYNYSDIHYPGQQQQTPPPPQHQPQHSEGGIDPRYRPHDAPPPQQHSSDSPYEYISARNLVNSRPTRGPGRGELSPPGRDDYDSAALSSRAFSNSVYMDHREVERARAGVAEGEPDSSYQAGYTRPRTDDEQLRELQLQTQRQHRARTRSVPAAPQSRLGDLRAKSETRLSDHNHPPDDHSAEQSYGRHPNRANQGSFSRWNKYKSWDSEKEGQRTFDSYKKLITPGFFGARKNLSKSHDELREESEHWGRGDSAVRETEGRSGSAFEAYRKEAIANSGLPSGGRFQRQTASPDQDFGHAKGNASHHFPPLPPPPPPPPAFTEMAVLHTAPFPSPPPPSHPYTLAGLGLTSFPPPPLPPHRSTVAPGFRQDLTRSEFGSRSKQSFSRDDHREILRRNSAKVQKSRPLFDDQRELLRRNSAKEKTKLNVVDQPEIHRQNAAVDVKVKSVLENQREVYGQNSSKEQKAKPMFDDQREILRRNTFKESKGRPILNESKEVGRRNSAKELNLKPSSFSDNREHFPDQNSKTRPVFGDRGNALHRQMSNEKSEPRPVSGQSTNSDQRPKSQIAMSESSAPRELSNRWDSARDTKVTSQLSKSMGGEMGFGSGRVPSSSAGKTEKLRPRRWSDIDSKIPVPVHADVTAGQRKANPASQQEGKQSLSSGVTLKIRPIEDSLPPPPSPPPPPPPPPPPAPGNLSDKIPSVELPPPPPPVSSSALPLTDAEKLKAESDAQALPKTHMPSPPPPPAPPLPLPNGTEGPPPSKIQPHPHHQAPPPPPPLVVTPLPWVNGIGASDEAKVREKVPLKRLSGGGTKDGEISAKPDEGEQVGGDRGGDKAEGVSKPNDVEAAAGLGQETESGQTVVDTARGVFTSAGGVLESKQTGVSIVIPEGALDQGSSQEIYFKVCSGNSILPPLDEDKGETLLSPLVMCGPHGLCFNKPVELRLPHSASVNPESWSFALKSSDSPSGQPTQWQNMTLAGSEGVAQGHVNQNSVSVLVDHF